MTKPAPTIEVTQAEGFSESKCRRCTESKCCSYITQAIETPRAKVDFQHLLWQVSHEHVSIYKEKAGWYLLFRTRCSHLAPDGSCKIYNERPLVCREYSNDYCEFDSPAEEGFDLLFEDYPTLLAYCKKRFRRWGA